MTADQPKGEEVGEDLEWVKGVLDRGLTGDSGLSDYEDKFLLDMDKRLARYGARTFLSERQRALLRDIDAKIKKSERLEEYGGFRATDELQ